MINALSVRGPVLVDEWGLVGAGGAMEELRRLIARVGPSPAVVLLEGETGAGKERVARAVHLASRRRGRFVAVNCAAIPATLLESELFGHEKGAFTGATARRAGRFEQAEGGTLFLDEIGDMPLELQAKLLRVLETREIELLGGTRPTAVDVRVIAATHCDLPAAMAAGRFRADLYFRLAVFPLRVPALRERPGDLPALVRAFAADLGVPEVTLTPEGEAALAAHPWPGNVRELRNLVERLALLAGHAPLVIDGSVRALLGAGVRPGGAPGVDGLGEKTYRELVDDFERTLLRLALDRGGGTVAAAARLLRADRGNLYRRMLALGLARAA